MRRLLPRLRRFRAPIFAIGAFLVLWLIVIPWPWGLGEGDPGLTSLMKQRISEARAAEVEFEIRREWVPLERISPSLQRAVLLAEDQRFREHGGVDWRALAEEVEWSGDDDFSFVSPSDVAALFRAMAFALGHRDELRGRSTITQQLAKNLWWGTERSFLRKVLEVPAALRLERQLGKDRILELYLNVAEWGPGIFGAEAAARAYFGRSAAELSSSQAAALAATLPHPLTSNPARNPARMEWRRARILEMMEGPVPEAPVEVPVPEVDLSGGAI